MTEKKRPHCLIYWADATLYTSFDLTCEGIAKLIIAISSVLNPDMVILQGEFISQDHILNVVKKCEIALPNSVTPEIFLSENFADDYLRGMIVQTLKTLEPSITLSKK